MSRSVASRPPLLPRAARATSAVGAATVATVANVARVLVLAALAIFAVTPVRPLRAAPTSAPESATASASPDSSPPSASSASVASSPATESSSPSVAPPQRGGTTFEVTGAVKQQLQHLQEGWQHWVSAPDRDHADAAVTDLLATAGQLGMPRLPDLSLGALAWAVEAARHKELARAAWSLAAAERLDPERPEVAFAEAAVARANGSYAGMGLALARGYPRLFWLPLFRYLWLQDLLTWGLCLLLLTGGLFVAALMATRGALLCRGLAAALGRRLPRAAVIPLVAAILLWPLALPGGFLWLPLSWSLLLWIYASRSERVVLAALWLLLGAAPLLVTAQQRAVAARLSPPVKALEALRQRRLYGGLFTDLGQLRSSLPDSPAVQHLMADVHRRLGQWDLARGFYRQVLESEPQNAAALLNLGVYSVLRGDTSSAIQYFQQAAAADPHYPAAALFDLSQAYNEAYLFDEAHRALAQAKSYDAESVDRWLRNVDQEKVVPANGGLALIPDIESSLIAPPVHFDLLHQWAPLAIAVGAILLAVAIQLARRSLGDAEAPFQWRLGHGVLDRWRRALLPGLSAAEAGEGGRAFLALLVPTALLLMPWFERLGYRIPWGYDGGGNAMAWTLSGLGLAVYLAARLRWERRNAL